MMRFASLRSSRVLGAGGLVGSAFLVAHRLRDEEAAVWCDAKSLSGSPAAATATEVNKVARRLGAVLNVDDTETATQRLVKQGVAIYGVKDESAHRASGGLPVVRVARTTIAAPLEDVAACWWRAGARKEWDSVNTQDSQLVRLVAPDQRLVYLQGKPKAGGVVSSRDFAYYMYRRPPQEVGAHLSSALFVQVNAPQEVPPNKASVRADVNSLLLLEPIDAGTTRATYVIEMDAKGWLPAKVVQAAADETPLMLAVMREYIEAGKAREGAMSPEDIAKRALRRRQSEADEAARPDVIHSAASTREELLAAKKLMEDRLVQLKKDERESGISYDDLRAKIRADLRDINCRL